MVVTRRKCMESPQTPFLVQESEVKELLMDSKLKLESTFDCTVSSVANNPTQLSKSLKTLVSDLSEDSLLGLLRLAGKEIHHENYLGKPAKINSFAIWAKLFSIIRNLTNVLINYCFHLHLISTSQKTQVDDVVRMLTGEESVILELYSVGILPSLPSDINSWKLSDGETRRQNTPEQGKPTRSIDSVKEVSGDNLFASKASDNQRITRSKASPGTFLRSKFGDHIIHFIPASRKRKRGSTDDLNLKHILFSKPDKVTLGNGRKKARRSMMR